MICRGGRIVRYDDGQPVVAVAPAGGCERCAAGQGCGMGILSRWFERGEVEITVAGPAGLQVGQAVRIEIQPSALVGWALLAYGLPLTGFMLGLAAGHWTGSEALALAGGLVGALLGFLASRLQDRPANIHISAIA